MEPLRLSNNRRQKVVIDLDIGEIGYVRIDSLRCNYDNFLFMRYDVVCMDNYRTNYPLKIMRVDEGLICFINEVSSNWKWPMDLDISVYENLEEFIDFSDEFFFPFFSIVAVTEDEYDEKRSKESCNNNEYYTDNLTVDDLKVQLQRAIDSEDYERASEIRDEINKKNNKPLS